MQLRIDRDSVCAGDDVEGHDELRRYEPQMRFGFVVQSILNSNFLPIFEKGTAFWVVSVDQRPIGVVCGKWEKPKFVVDADSELQSQCRGAPSTLYFPYRF